MPGYTYVAVDEKGKEKRGRMDAENRDAVSQQLKKDGLFPVEIKEQGVMNKDIDFSIGKKVKPRDLSVFRQESQATRLKCVLPAVRQHYAGRRAHERSTADDDRADRKQMAEESDCRCTGQCGKG